MFSGDYTVLVLVTILANICFLASSVSSIRSLYINLFQKEKTGIKPTICTDFLLYCISVWSAGFLFLELLNPVQFELFLIVAGIDSALLILLLVLERVFVKTRH